MECYDTTFATLLDKFAPRESFGSTTGTLVYDEDCRPASPKAPSTPATMSKQRSTFVAFNNVASTMLLVWTGFKATTRKLEKRYRQNPSGLTQILMAIAVQQSNSTVPEQANYNYWSTAIDSYQGNPNFPKALWSKLPALLQPRPA